MSGPTPQSQETQLKDLPLDQLLKELNTSTDGITQSDAESRLQHYGPNELAEKKTRPSRGTYTSCSLWRQCWVCWE